MSRSILIKVTFRNGVTRARGIYNSKNAEHFSSFLSYIELYDTFEILKREVSRFRIKKIEIIHNVSTGNNANENMVQTYFDIDEIEITKSVDLNKALYIPYLP